MGLRAVALRAVGKPVAATADAALMNLHELHAAALRDLIVTRLAQRLPALDPVDDWRFGFEDATQRAKLRPFLPTQTRAAAVLVPLVMRDDEISVLLTQRATHLKNHAGQISFPGGRVERADADATATALRETEEEIGLNRRYVSIVGRLPDHLIVSGFRVTPVVGFVQSNFELTLDRNEVESTFEVPLRFILDPKNHIPRLRHFEGHSVTLTDVPWGAHQIWGATASMLLTFYRVLRGDDE